MSVSSYKMYYADGKVIEHKDAACFSAYTYRASPDIKGISYNPTKVRRGGITLPEVKEYYDVLLNEFNFKDYLEDYPTVKSVIRRGIRISAELPTGTALFMLTAFRYLEECPIIVKNFLTLRKIKGDMTEAQAFEWAHKIGSGGLYGVNTNHTIFDTSMTSFCDGNMMDVFLNDWDRNLPHYNRNHKQSLLSTTFRSKKYGSALFGDIRKPHVLGCTVENILYMVKVQETIKAFEERKKAAEEARQAPVYPQIPEGIAL